MTTESPWANVPRVVRSAVRSYINSENEKDRERALQFCEQYQLDYATMRQVIMREMVAESRALAARKAPADQVSRKLI